MTPIYVAAKFTARERLQKVRSQLAERGYRLISSWLLVDDGVTYESAPEQARETAERDLREIDEAVMFVIDTLDESNTGGREVELGTALSLGLICARVGPARNVFHYLARGYNSWSELLDAMPSGFGRPLGLD